MVLPPHVKAAKGGAGAYLEAVVEAAYGGRGTGERDNADWPIGPKQITRVEPHLGAQDGVNAYVTVYLVGELYGEPFPFIYHFSMALRRKYPPTI